MSEIVSQSRGLPGNSGAYAGDGNPNKPIAHGLSRRPNLVFIHDLAASTAFDEIADGASIQNIGVSILAVTVSDSTYFYVGNATSYVNSANNVGSTYRWAAF
jgi:hypothetical protein